MRKVKQSVKQNMNLTGAGEENKGREEKED